MPYIPQESREFIRDIVDWDERSTGELNFLITTLIKDYIRVNGGLNYQRIAEVTGVLKNVSDEFYRRVAVPYEDKKREENGDVY